MPRARVVLIARDGGEGPSYPVTDATDIGRFDGNIVIATDRYISPRHARITLRGGAFFLRDLESTNGIFMRIPFAQRAFTDSQEDTSAATYPPPNPSPGRDPAARVSNAHAPSGDPAGKAGREPAQASASSTSQDAYKPADSAVLLTDEDLFLVGQQVLKLEVVKHAEAGFGVASENGTLLFGTPAAARYARLSQRTVEGIARDVFHLSKAETVIGRESGDIVFTDDVFLSRRHAVVRRHAGAEEGAPARFTLADLGSSNGTFLRIREEVRLVHGDHFRIGQQLFRFDT